ncbi:MAG: DUF2384 domain-containing protein [Gammaproteobacteria bacterium]|nr:DUF2384 domain-containing protein [Gammaproteobacteria bacterium]
MTIVPLNEMPHEEQIALTRAVMAILDSWGLSSVQQIAVLNLPQGTPLRAMRRYRENTPFPDSPAVLERLDHIIGIADALRTTYPHNPAMGVLWLQQLNRRFQERPPLAIIVENGLQGLLQVRMHLDCSYDWHLDSN